MAELPNVPETLAGLDPWAQITAIIGTMLLGGGGLAGWLAKRQAERGQGGGQGPEGIKASIDGLSAKLEAFTKMQGEILEAARDQGSQFDRNLTFFRRVAESAEKLLEATEETNRILGNMRKDARNGER